MDIELSDKDWEEVEFYFWPRKIVTENLTEPDVVVVSSKWVIVVEVKLHSGLGSEQIHRELQVGAAIAQERNIPTQAVYFLAQTLVPPDFSRILAHADGKQFEEMQGKTLYIRWSDALEIVDAWRRSATDMHVKRILNDLASSLRRRRSLAFSGFKIRGHGCVPISSYFMSNAFIGFLHGSLVVQNAGPFFMEGQFSGFLKGTFDCSQWHSWLKGPTALFRGFLNCAKTVTPTMAPRFSSTGFNGFLLTVKEVLRDDVWTIKGDER